MDALPRQGEYQLPLAKIAQLAGGDARVGHVHAVLGEARLGLEWADEPAISGPAADFSPEPDAPQAVTAPWCATWLARAPQLRQLQRLLDFFARQGWSVSAMDTLSRRRDRTAIRFQLQAQLDFEAARHACLREAEALGADLVLQPGSSQRVPKLAGFDMDSTLIDAEVIDELAKILGIGDQVAAITESAMRGELDFQQSFRKRMSLLRGFSEPRLAEVAAQLPLKPGARELLSALRALECKTAILSGGFTYFANYLRDNKLPVDFVYANQLEFADGALTGGVIEPIIDGARKRALLTQLAEDLALPLEQVIAVGDGANDIPMLRLGALGIAIHPKPRVRQEAPQSIEHFGLDAALYMFGLNDNQIAALGKAAP